MIHGLDGSCDEGHDGAISLLVGYRNGISSRKESDDAVEDSGREFHDETFLRDEEI
jgi:hypothetical protein